MALPNWHFPKGESQQHHWHQEGSKAVQSLPVSTVAKENPCLARMIIFLLHVVFFFFSELVWNSLTMETVSPFLAQSEESFKNVEFMHFFASLITSEVRVDRLNLHGEEWVWVLGLYPHTMTGPGLQTGNSKRWGLMCGSKRRNTIESAAPELGKHGGGGEASLLPRQPGSVHNSPFLHFSQFHEFSFLMLLFLWKTDDFT